MNTGGAETEEETECLLRNDGTQTYNWTVEHVYEWMRKRRVGGRLAHLKIILKYKIDMFCWMFSEILKAEYQ